MRSGVIQGKFVRGLPAVSARAQDPIQRSTGRASGVVPLEPAALRLPAGGGRPLPEGVRRHMEEVFGAGLGEVRIHEGPHASALGAAAFTLGSEIHFAPGQFVPGTGAGRQLLGHEIAHVLQQRSGRVRNPLGAGLVVLQDPALEAEAERLGLRAAQVIPRQPAAVILPAILHRSGAMKQAPPQRPGVAQRSKKDLDDFVDNSNYSGWEPGGGKSKNKSRNRSFPRERTVVGNPNFLGGPGNYFPGGFQGHVFPGGQPMPYFTGVPPGNFLYGGYPGSQFSGGYPSIVSHSVHHSFPWDSPYSNPQVPGGGGPSKSKPWTTNKKKTKVPKNELKSLQDTNQQVQSQLTTPPIPHLPRYFKLPEWGTFDSQAGGTSVDVILGPAAARALTSVSSTPGTLECTTVNDLNDPNQNHSNARFYCWVKGHILNAELGGTTTSENLTALTHQGNMAFKGFEAVLKKAIEWCRRQADDPWQTYFYGVRFKLRVSGKRKWPTGTGPERNVADHVHCSLAYVKQLRSDPTALVEDLDLNDPQPGGLFPNPARLAQVSAVTYLCV